MAMHHFVVRRIAFAYVDVEATSDEEAKSKLVRVLYYEDGPSRSAIDKALIDTYHVQTNNCDTSFEYFGCDSDSPFPETDVFIKS